MSLVERELKLEVPESFSVALLSGTLDEYTLGPVELRRLHTVYYDTGDLRLTRWGCSLRFRHDEGWTLKLPLPQRANARVREEHTFAGGSDTIPAAALDLATAYLRGEVPRPAAELRTVRATRCVYGADEKALAELVEDDVRVVDGARVVERFHELEIELTKDAPDGMLDALDVALHAAGAGPPDPTPKNVRVLGSRAREPEIVVPKLDANARIGDVVRAAFAGSVEQLVRYDAKLRLNPDEETIHQARVAVRRLRSDLRTFSSVLDGTWTRGVRDALGWLGDGLAAARDADVLLERFTRNAETLGTGDRPGSAELLRAFAAARDAAHGRVVAMLHEERYIALLRDAVDAAKRPVLSARAAEHACDALAGVMADAWRELRRAVRRRSRPPSNRELHRIRIKAKRVRYAAEAFVPVAGRRARRFAKRVERLQTILGEQHDAVVAEARLRELAEEPAAFVAGELLGFERDAACDARERWRHAWRGAAKRRLRFWRT